MPHSLQMATGSGSSPGKRQRPSSSVSRQPSPPARRTLNASCRSSERPPSVQKASVRSPSSEARPTYTPPSPAARPVTVRLPGSICAVSEPSAPRTRKSPAL